MGAGQSIEERKVDVTVEKPAEEAETGLDSALPSTEAPTAVDVDLDSVDALADLSAPLPRRSVLPMDVVRRDDVPSLSEILVPDTPAAPPSRLLRIDGVPVIVFVNGRSGGGMGSLLLARFRTWLGEDQVFDLGEVGRSGPQPEEVLARFVDVPDCRVLVCGGDGTCSWLLAAVDAVCACRKPSSSAVLPIAVMHWITSVRA